MQAKDIENDLKKFVGGGSFIRPGELAKYLGQKNAQRVKQRFLTGVFQIESTSSYYIPEVAKNIFYNGEWTER